MLPCLLLPDCYYHPSPHHRTATLKEKPLHYTYLTATSRLPHPLLPPYPYLTATSLHCYLPASSLQGGHGTAESGGGYRYDGLYTVETAALVPSHNTRFKTAMFTLVRCKL